MYLSVRLSAVRERSGPGYWFFPKGDFGKNQPGNKKDKFIKQ
jgi:hypothetical protein